MKNFVKEKIKLIIADDNAGVRKGLIQIISETSDLTVVAEVGNGNDLLDKVREIAVDVVLIDIGMLGKSGWDVLTQLKNEFPELRVMILSIFLEKIYAVKLYKAGASAYLHKTRAPEQLVEAIRKVARGQVCHSINGRETGLCCEFQRPQKQHKVCSSGNSE